MSISDILKISDALEPVQAVEPIAANELLAPLPDFDFKPIVVAEWEMPGFSVPIESLPPVIANPDYWDKSIIDAMSQTAISPQHGEGKSIADSFTQPSHNAHDWLIVSEAWQMIEEDWEHKCKRGDNIRPDFSWRGLRVRLRALGYYYGAFIDVVQNSEKNDNVNRLSARYWAVVDYVDTTDLIYEYDADPLASR